MEALSSMQSFLRSRPFRFHTLDYAIEWCIQSGQVRNSESARVSMPAQLKSVKSGKCGTDDIDVSMDVRDQKGGEKPAPVLNANSIAEEDEESEEAPKEKPVSDKGDVKPPIITQRPFVPPGYTWRIDLSGTEPHWSGWFQGLSEKFLSVPASKLLLLAGVDRLDR